MTALILKVFWIIGFTISTAGLFLQGLIYLLFPCSRELSQKLLTQLTVTRFLYILFEYLALCVRLKDDILNNIVFALYVQTDAALICWMFIFTKNLYDDVVNVFVQKPSFIIVTVIIWSVTLPIGLICPFLMELDFRRLKENPNADLYFKVFYDVYAYVKFIILTVNLLLFCLIFKAAMKRSDRSVSVLRTCVVSFVLVSISSVQVFVADLLAFSLDEYPMVSLVFGVINSYQIIAITAIFVMITQNACKGESFSKKIVRKFVTQAV